MNFRNRSLGTKKDHCPCCMRETPQRGPTAYFEGIPVFVSDETPPNEVHVINYEVMTVDVFTVKEE